MKTRAKRYANHKGGRKFVTGETAKVEADERVGVMGGRAKRRKLENANEGEDWEGREEKKEASLVFREVWEKAKDWEGYIKMKAEFLERQQRWKKEKKSDGGSWRDAKNSRKRKFETEDDGDAG